MIKCLCHQFLLKYTLCNPYLYTETANYFRENDKFLVKYCCLNLLIALCDIASGSQVWEINFMAFWVTIDRFNDFLEKWGILYRKNMVFPTWILRWCNFGVHYIKWNGCFIFLLAIYDKFIALITIPNHTWCKRDAAASLQE